MDDGRGHHGPGKVTSELVYERRFGARNQLELVVPVVFQRPGGDWRGGIGDIALGVKRAVFHSFPRGTIFSVGGEVILPTGDRDEGFGAGVTRLEPFLALGQALPLDGFLQLQAGAEVPTDPDRFDPELFWRGALGTSLTQGRFGRTWSPMIEVLAVRALADEARTHWDIAPQVQVTLNTRQHVMANVAARLPLTEASTRRTRILVYLLLDWFDGGFFEGW